MGVGGEVSGPSLGDSSYTIVFYLKTSKYKHGQAFLTLQSVTSQICNKNVS